MFDFSDVAECMSSYTNTEANAIANKSIHATSEFTLSTKRSGNLFCRSILSEP